MTYYTNTKGPFTAGKSTVWVEAETIQECIDLYVTAANEHNLGMGSIYRTENPEKRFFLNAKGAIVGEWSS